MASYFEWKKINKKDYEEIRKAFIIAANEYELEKAFKLFYDKINNLSEDDGK
jgi:hypothetical protein